MAKKIKSVKTGQKIVDSRIAFAVLGFFAIVVIALTVMVVQSHVSLDTRGHAAENSGLSTGDDVNSLESDLNVLGKSTSDEDLIHFNNVQ
jgi:hypothetical protein